MSRPWQRRESFVADRPATPCTASEGPVVKPRERSLDRSELDLVALAEREVALLLEDLCRGGCLRSVRHRARGDDRFGELRAEPRLLREEDHAGIEGGAGHDRIVPARARRPRRSRAILDAMERSNPSDTTIQIDPVCGMEVDPAATDLKLEHDGTTYWFCGRGCLLEFRDDPDHFLDPDYQPSM
jgi:YHS domain-containing protein